MRGKKSALAPKEKKGRNHFAQTSKLGPLFFLLSRFCLCRTFFCCRSWAGKEKNPDACLALCVCLVVAYFSGCFVSRFFPRAPFLCTHACHTTTASLHKKKGKRATKKALWVVSFKNEIKFLRIFLCFFWVRWARSCTAGMHARIAAGRRRAQKKIQKDQQQ